MMLSDLEFNPFYNTYDNDIASEFYTKALSNAVSYKRVSAYFSAKALAYYSKGISEIVKKNGKIDFIISKEISEETYNAIVAGYKKREEIEQELIQSLKEEVSLKEEKRLSNLAFLIEIGVVDIKIAFVKKGIFHDKFGVIEDEYNNIVYFRGSNNETVEAIENNYESFEVSLSWNEDEFEIQKIENAKRLFEELWNNDVDDIFVIEIPDIVKNQIILFKGQDKLISEREIEIFDSLFIDIDINENLKIINRLPEGKISKKDYFFQIYLNRFFYFKDNEFEIKHKVNYIEIKKIIEYFKEYSKKNYFKLIISNRLEKYIASKDMQIEERKKIGIDIKNKESYLEAGFIKFKNILENEMIRKLKEPQLWNAFHIVNLWRSANFSVPGAGKTTIVYGAFAYLNSKEINAIDKIIMIGPKNSFYSWKDEFINNFGEKKELKVLDIQDEKFKNAKQRNYEIRNSSGNKNVILINYEALPSMEKSLLDILNDRAMLVFDEEHKIKSINGIRANIALELAKKVKYKVVLTGTPIPNGYQDIYNCLKILYPDEYDYMFNFKIKELQKPSDFEMKDINEKIYPFYCRITKKDLMIPKPNEDIIIKSKMDKNEKIIFKYIYQKYNTNILALYIRLMQASTNPRLLLKKLNKNDLMNIFWDDEHNGEINEFDSKDDKYKNLIFDGISDVNISDIIHKSAETTKFKKGISLVQKLSQNGKQILVWGIFIDTLNLIKEKLDRMNIKCKIIDGRVAYNERHEIIEEFKNKKFQVLIANPNTLAESVSLHTVCHDAIYFEYSFNLTHMLQSKDRINRLGLQTYTQYYYLMLENDEDRYNAIDEKIYYRLKYKEKIMKEAIESTTLKRVDFDDEDDLKLIMNKH